MSEHDDKILRCTAETDDASVCDTEIEYSEHGTYQEPLAGTDRRGTPLRDRFERSALRFKCPDCGAVHHACPVCYGDGTPGWFRGATSGEMIACHNCNSGEAARQRRQSRGRY